LPLAVATWFTLAACSPPPRTPTVTNATGAPSRTPPGTADNTGRDTIGTAAEPDAGRSESDSDAGFAQPARPVNREAARHAADGAAAFARGDFRAAVAAFRTAYGADPSPEMAFNVARVYERVGDVTEGLRYYEIALRTNPPPAQRADIERRIAGLRAYEQRRRDGIAQVPPSTGELSAEGMRMLQSGVRLFMRRQYRGALVAFQQAYQYLQTPEVLFNLAAAHERLHHTDQALEFLREYQQQVRGSPEEAEVRARIERLETQQ
jgi:tetratricopeptide (TPR) repeat protein